MWDQQVSYTNYYRVLKNVTDLLWNIAENITIPKNYNGSIIEDLGSLSNDYCGNSVDYKICIFDTERSNCFDIKNLQNKNNIIYILISEGESGAQSVSLQVNSITNGTVISVFCISQDCASHISNVLLTSLQILCKLILLLSLGIIL